MKRLRRILYVFEDEPERNASLARAVDLARRTGASLTLAAVLERPERPEEEAAARAYETVYRELEREAREALASIARDHREGLPGIQCRVLVGTPHVEIVREVLREKHDLVMKTASPIGGLAAHLFGTLDTRLVELCPCPVWIDKPIPHERYERILAAVQVLEQETPEHAVTILEIASSIAEIEQAELHVLNVWSLPGETRLRGRAFTEAVKREIDMLVEHEQKRHEAALEALLSPFRERPIEIRAHLVKGTPEVAIPEQAERLGIDLIVMGSHVHSHLVGLLLGTVTEAVLRQAKCALLTVKPPDFETPITLEES